MDLRQYFLENCTNEDYHYRFKKDIENNHYVDDLFGIDYGGEYDDIEIYDDEEAIRLFLELLDPSNERGVKGLENNRRFWMLCFYLEQNNYFVEQFPECFRRPTDWYDFSNKKIREYLIRANRNNGARVEWSERRKFIGELSIKKRDQTVILSETTDELFKKVSTRNSSFTSMSTFEKLKEIVNVTENLLKVGGKFVCIDYNATFLGYIDEDKITEYRKKIQCFRHATKESLMERESYSEQQLQFLIDFGLIIIKQLENINNTE